MMRSVRSFVFAAMCSLILAGSFALFPLASAAPAQAATGGGCSTGSGNGVTIEVCTFARGGNVVPEINIVDIPLTPKSCTVRGTLFRDGQNVSGAFLPCARGRQTWEILSSQAGLHYTRGEVDIDNVTQATAIVPY